MTVRIDPKAILTPPETPANEANPQTRASLPDIFTDPLEPEAARSALDLLFSGLKRVKEFQSPEPQAEIVVPKLEEELIRGAPSLGRSSFILSEITTRYEILKAGLLERRQNYTQALEGKLRPEEAMDLFGRVDAIDQALFEIEQNLDLAALKMQKVGS